LLIQRLAVLGTGLIGGSVALAAKRAGVACVTGFDTNAAALSKAAALVVDRAAAGPADAVAGAQLIILAMPVSGMPRAASDISDSIGSGAVVTDVGSAKAEVVDALQGILGEHFVGGHPMSGSERRGIDAATPDLFEGAPWIITPTNETSARAYRTVREFVTDLGAAPVAVEPLAHDQLIARLSHLPQLAASVLVDVAVRTGEKDALLGLAANGFRDVTRIAASDPDLWVTILEANRRAVLDSLEGFQETLGRVTRTIAERDWESLRSFMDSSRTARLQMFAKPVSGPPVTLELVIPDRPGVLAEVTTAAGGLGVNIEDLQILHSPEGGEGRLELVVAGAGGARSLGIALRRLGYTVSGEEASTSRQIDK
jgi:prephenate dehydrogenase